MKGKGKKIRNMFLGAVLVCAAITLDSRYRIETSVYELFSSRLPERFDGYRIVQISDLHGVEFGRGDSWLLRAVSNAVPDIIVMTGDFIDDADEMPAFESLITSLCRIAPVYFVSGNHDWSSGAIEQLAEMLNRHGVTYLRNEFRELTSGDESIVLCGVEDPNSLADLKKPDALVQELRETYPDSYVLLLGHRNYWKSRYPTLDVDAILSGHAHGGIVRIPFVGGIIGTNMELFPEHTDGVYSSGRYDLVVSRGLGNSAPVPRFLNNPHLPVIVLRRSEGV